VNKPIDRLHYADCAYSEGALRAQELGEVFPKPLPPAFDVDTPCPLCKRDSPGNGQRARAALSTADLDALYLGFRDAATDQFDHVGFAQAVIAAFKP
jgi:hypothetical protein